MALNLGTLTATLGLDIGPWIKNLAVAQTQLEKAAQRIGGAGARLGIGLTAPLVGAATVAIKASAAFEQTFLRINTLAGVGEAAIKEFRKQVLALSRDVGRGPQELAEALYAVTSQGIRGAEAMQVVEASAKAAVLGLGETQDVVRAVTAALNAYGTANLTAERATEILVATVREGAAEADVLAKVIGRVLGPASQLGVSLEEVGASIATFTRLGVRAEEAVIGLRGTIQTLIHPSQAAQKEMERFGITTEKLLASVRGRGLAQTLVDLVNAFGGNIQALSTIIPNMRAFASVTANAGAQQKSYLKVLHDITDTYGDLNNQFSKATQTTQFSLDQLSARFQELAITAGDRLAPALKAIIDATLPLIEAAIRLVEQFGELPKSVQAFIISALAAAAAVGVLATGLAWVLGIAGALVRFLPALAGGWGTVIAVVVGLILSTGVLGASIEKLGNKLKSGQEKASALAEAMKKIPDTQLPAIGVGGVEQTPEIIAKADFDRIVKAEGSITRIDKALVVARETGKSMWADITAGWERDTDDLKQRLQSAFTEVNTSYIGESFIHDFTGVGLLIGDLVDEGLQAALDAFGATAEGPAADRVREALTKAGFNVPVSFKGDIEGLWSQLKQAFGGAAPPVETPVPAGASVNQLVGPSLIAQNALADTEDAIASIEQQARALPGLDSVGKIFAEIEKGVKKASDAVGQEGFDDAQLKTFVAGMEKLAGDKLIPLIEKQLKDLESQVGRPGFNLWTAQAALANREAERFAKVWGPNAETVKRLQGLADGAARSTGKFRQEIQAIQDRAGEKGLDVFVATVERYNQEIGRLRGLGDPESIKLANQLKQELDGIIASGTTAAFALQKVGAASSFVGAGAGQAEAAMSAVRQEMDYLSQFGQPAAADISRLDHAFAAAAISSGSFDQSLILAGNAAAQLEGETAGLAKIHDGLSSALIPLIILLEEMRIRYGANDEGVIKLGERVKFLTAWLEKITWKQSFTNEVDDSSKAVAGLIKQIATLRIQAGILGEKPILAGLGQRFAGGAATPQRQETQKELGAAQSAFQGIDLSKAGAFDEAKSIGATIDALEALDAKMGLVEGAAAGFASIIGDAVDRSVLGFIQGTKSIQQAWYELWTSLIAQAISALTRLLAEELAYWAARVAMAWLFGEKEVVAEAVTGQEKVAVHTATEAEKTAVTEGFSIARIGTAISEGAAVIAAKVIEGTAWVAVEALKLVASLATFAVAVAGALTMSTAFLSAAAAAAILAIAMATMPITALLIAVTAPIAAVGLLIMATAAKTAAIALAAASVAAIPYVGGFIAPLAAAWTAAAIVAAAAIPLPAARSGALLKADQAIQAHEGELVLPKEISSGLVSMIKNGGGSTPGLGVGGFRGAGGFDGGGTTKGPDLQAHFHMGFVDPRDASRYFDNHGGEIAKQLNKEYRRYNPNLRMR